MQVTSTDCLKTPNELFWENEILNSPQRFKDCFDAEDDPDKKVVLQKWYICHLILASEYAPLNQAVETLLEIQETEQLSDTSDGDIKYCQALKSYYQGYFQATIDIFFPKGKKNLFEHHLGDDYQMGHDHFLLGKAYLKMSYFTRAYFHFYQAIHYFAKKNLQSIWIPKVFGLIAVAYFQEEKFEDGEHFVNLAISKLEKDLGEAHADHHVYASLCTDLGIGYLAKGKNAPNQAQRSQDYHEANHWLGEGEEIFNNIYKGNSNRYNALIFKNFGVLDKRRAKEIAPEEDASDRYKEAMDHLNKDLEIRKELFKDSSTEDVPHHTTLGDTCNIIAKLKLQQADRLKTQRIHTQKLQSINQLKLQRASNRLKLQQSNRVKRQQINRLQFQRVTNKLKFQEVDSLSKEQIDRLKLQLTNQLKLQQAKIKSSKQLEKAFLLENIHHANMAMHYVVKGYQYKDINAAELSLDILKNGIKHKDLNESKDLIHVQSYFYLLLAFHLKLKALKHLLEITPAYQCQVLKDDFYSIIKICSTFIFKVREQYKNDLANFALDKITRPLFESMLSFLYAEYEVQKKNGAVLDELHQMILDTLESSKNYDIVQAIEKDEIHIEQGDQVIRDLSCKFRACLQEDGSLKQEEEAIDFLKKRHKKISKLCQDLRVQDLKESEVHYAIGKNRVTLTKVKEKMKELAIKINEGQNDQDTSIISFFFGKKEIFAFTINSEDCGFFKLDIEPQQLKKQIEQLVGVMNQPDRERYVAEYHNWLSNNNLYEKLIEDLEIPENIRFLVFIPDQDLNQLPFDIIPHTVNHPEDHSKINIEYLIQKYHTSYHYSISMLYNSVEPSTSDPQHSSPPWTTNYLGISSNYYRKPRQEQNASSNGEDSDDKANLILEVTNTGLQIIQAGIPQDSVQCYVEKLYPPYPDELKVTDLAQPKVINENLCHTQILHFATHHATSDVTLIRLNKEYTIGLDEINETRNVALVILHGCNTGRNESSDKNATNKSLGRLFLAKKGVRNVIYSVTTVINSIYEDSEKGSDPSSDLIAKFFELLLKNINSEDQGKRITYPVALSRAKAEILSTEEYNFFPPFVAGLIFVGCPTDYFYIETNKKNS